LRPTNRSFKVSILDGGAIKVYFGCSKYRCCCCCCPPSVVTAPSSCLRVFFFFDAPDSIILNRVDSGNQLLVPPSWNSRSVHIYSRAGPYKTQYSHDPRPTTNYLPHPIVYADTTCIHILQLHTVATTIDSFMIHSNSQRKVRPRAGCAVASVAVETLRLLPTYFPTSLFSPFSLRTNAISSRLHCHHLAARPLAAAI
jgi:hypothetical protein